MKSIKHIAVILTLGVLPLSLQAMSLSYDFTDPSNIALVKMFPGAGVDIKVTAQQIADGTNIVSTAYVSQNGSGGIGVCSFTSGTSCDGSMDNTAIDSLGPDEVLNFATSSAIRVDTLWLTSYNTGTNNRDWFYFTVDGVTLNGGNAFKITGSGNDEPWDVSGFFGTSIVAQTSFSIRAVTTGTGDDARKASFRIKNMTATKLPEPGTLGMLLLGLAAIGFIRRRKS